MANYPKELEDFLDVCMTNGSISPDERRVLLNKAIKLNIDPEEFDLYIDAQVQKYNQKLKKAKDDAIAEFNGRTCPHCSTPIPALADKCPNCGAQTTAKAEKELEEIIDALEEALVDFKSGKDFARNKANVERYVRKAKMYYGNNPKIKLLLEEINIETENAEKKAKKDASINFLKNNLFWIIFGVIIIIEVLFIIKFGGDAETYLSNYNNYIGSRSDMYDLYKSASTNKGWCIFALICTVIIGFVIVNKRRKK